MVRSGYWNKGKLKYSTKYFSTATSLCIFREKIQQNDNSLAQETGQHRDEMLILPLAPKEQSIWNYYFNRFIFRFNIWMCSKLCRSLLIESIIHVNFFVQYGLYGSRLTTKEWDYELMSVHRIEALYTLSQIS